jgi:hypothetical protein
VQAREVVRRDRCRAPKVTDTRHNDRLRLCERAAREQLPSAQQVFVHVAEL